MQRVGCASYRPVNRLKVLRSDFSQVSADARHLLSAQVPMTSRRARTPPVAAASRRLFLQAAPLLPERNSRKTRNETAFRIARRKRFSPRLAAAANRRALAA